MAVKRARPWLGTLVSIQVAGLEDSQAARAIDAAFREVETVHRRMSFHEPDSDVGRLNRAAHREPVAVHPYTFEVLRLALEVSAGSHGCFDISVASDLVDREMLPRPAGLASPQSAGWSDIELLAGGRVSYHRPLWIDLGGIAKGYAVDRAMGALCQRGASEAVVNAGGDIRVHGNRMERIGLALEAVTDRMPVIDLANGSIAGSSGHRERRWYKGQLSGPHLRGTDRAPAPVSRFVCVLAERRVIADALTKVVMAEGAASAKVLRKFGASGHFHDPAGGWQHLDTETETT